MRKSNSVRVSIRPYNLAFLKAEGERLRISDLTEVVNHLLAEIASRQLTPSPPLPSSPAQPPAIPNGLEGLDGLI